MTGRHLAELRQLEQRELAHWLEETSPGTAHERAILARLRRIRARLDRVFREQGVRAAVWRLARGQRGSVAVEFALTLPVLIVLMLGTLDTGLATVHLGQAHHAARVAAHVAADTGNATSGENAGENATALPVTCDVAMSETEADAECAFTYKAVGPFGSWPIRAAASWPLPVVS